MRFVLPKIKYLIPDFEFLLDAVLTLVVKEAMQVLNLKIMSGPDLEFIQVCLQVRLTTIPVFYLVALRY